MKDVQKEDLIRQWEETGRITDDRIISAFRDVLRENFVLKEHNKETYSDYPLPIGFGQSISQPTTVMLMIKYLEVKKTHKVLEIGTGSGYNAALLSKLCKKVYTIEFVKELCDFAKENLEKSGIKNVEVIHTDGSKGYKKEAPYDRIIITAAAPRIPEPLIDQLKVGGVIVAPVGSIYEQEMVKLTKTESGYKYKELGRFRFVQLKGEHGF